MLRFPFLLLAGLFLGSANATLTELTGIVDVSVGDNSCALTSAGGVKCWGIGILGDGKTDGNGRPVAGDVVGLTSGVAAVGVARRVNYQTTRGGHTCVAMRAGGLKCWGPDSDGQLGNGAVFPTNAYLPADVIGVTGKAVAVAGGITHTCAVMETGGVKCWGANDLGQLGIGTIGSRSSTPLDVVGLAGSAVAISAGPNHTCVIISGNGAQCWGSNGSGQLGDGTKIDRPSPVSVAGLPADVKSISAGGGVEQLGYQMGGHTCAVTGSGVAKCWGSYRALGSGDDQQHVTPFDVVGMNGGVAKISAGGILDIFPAAHTCAATDAGAALCWGDDGANQIGDGGPINQFPISQARDPTPTPVATLGSGVTAISAGHRMTCAVMADTKMKCWGRGGLGNGQDLGQVSTPVTVLTGTLPQAIVVPQQQPLAIGASRSIVASAGKSGNPITYASLTPAFCSVSGNVVTGIASGICQMTANQAGDAYYDPAPQVVFHFRIGDPVPQTITFGPAPSVPVGGYGSLTATASSGLKPVTFGSNTPGICSVSGNIVTGLAVGSCTVVANRAGDELYAPAPETPQTFPITANTGTRGLIVTRVGTGSGTVSSVPSGIDCGDVCAGNFPASVTLTATAAAGSKFAGWGGTACDRSTGPCVLPMSADTSIGALFVIDSPIPRLGNISTRGLASAADPLIAGFTIGGNTPKTIVITAAGPSLNAFGINNALSNPNLQLVRSADNAIVATNEDWGNASNAGELQATTLAPNHPLEPAIMATLAPGAYTAIVRGAGSEVGVTLAGVFEADHPEIPITNLSTRAVVATANNVMIAGFIVQGSNPQTVVVNVAGPSLSSFGVNNPLANPKLTIVRASDNTIIATNDDWQAQTNPSDVAAIQSTGFQPNNAAEPAVKLTLPPGAYTAIVEGVGGTTGTAVVGVFAVP